MTNTVYYWPLPFRGNFIKILLEDQGVPYHSANTAAVVATKNAGTEQPLPGLAPPFIDLDGEFLNQMPAIMQYLGRRYNCEPQDPFLASVALKVVLDCNDVLSDITRANGGSMWTRPEWELFRSERLPAWLQVFEAIAKRFISGPEDYFLGSRLSYADYAVYALWGTMIRCLPELEEDIRREAPTLSALIDRIGQREPIARFVTEQAKQWGSLYCGGQIEESIRSMLND